MPGKIENVRAFLLRKSDSSQLRRLELENRFRCQLRPSSLQQTIENHISYLAAQLLIHDRAYQRVERRLAEPDAVRFDSLDDAPQYRISFLKMYDGFTH